MFNNTNNNNNNNDNNDNNNNNNNNNNNEQQQQRQLQQTEQNTTVDEKKKKKHTQYLLFCLAVLASCSRSSFTFCFFAATVLSRLRSRSVAYHVCRRQQQTKQPSNEQTTERSNMQRIQNGHRQEIFVIPQRWSDTNRGVRSWVALLHGAAPLNARGGGVHLDIWSSPDGRQWVACRRPWAALARSIGLVNFSTYSYHYYYYYGGP